jgi:hypothetical protein
LPFGPWLSALFWALSVAAVLPLLRVARPPLQDMPQHLAAISVLRHYPELSLGDYFTIEPLRTQYLAYYGAAYLGSFLFGVELANKLLLCAAIVALPWSLAAFSKALGRDPAPAVFAFGLTYNAHLVLGFFNFIAALPLMFVGFRLALRMRRSADPRAERRAGAWLALLLLLCFYTHVVPFAFLALGSALILTGAAASSDSPTNLRAAARATARRAWVFVPAGAAFVGWLLLTPAGGSTLAAAGSGGAQFATVNQALRDLPMWLTDVLAAERDEQLGVAWFVLLISALVVGLLPVTAAGDAFKTAPRESDPLAGRLGFLCPLAVAGYFLAPTGYDWIWPISARFPLLALLFACLLIPRLSGALGKAVVVAAALVALSDFWEVGRAFASFEADEVGDFDAALDAIPPGQRVAGLIFDRGSRVVKFSPFLQYVAYYQARKGGAVMFTFADFPQSPFRFRPERRPPPVSPRWEWMPERVDPARDLGWYDFVLVRGGPGRIAREPGPFERVFAGSRWQVYARRR